MKLQRIVVLLVMVNLVAGCSYTSSLLESKKIDYKSAGKVPSLEVPPDLTAPATDSKFVVPDVNTQGSVTFSDYAHGAPAQATAASGVLPNQPKVTVERAGSERWLLVRATPEQVWPVVKEFWQDMGLIIKTENPQTGVMETDWAENRANLPQDAVRSALGKLIDGLYSTAERDKFRTRLERGKETGTTEVYISHRGMYEVIEGGDGGNRTVWEPRPADPGLEADMLRRLMVRFGVEEARAQTELASAPAAERAKLGRADDGVQTLTVNDPFDRAWRRVGLALDRVGFTVVDRDRSKGLYFVRYADPDVDGKKGEKSFLSRLAFWKSDEAKALRQEQYRILVDDRNDASVVEVQGKDGKGDGSETAGKILKLLYEQLK